MELQMIFDKVLYGIRVQGRPGGTGEGSGTYCAYRSKAGACGVGQLLSDQDYDPAFDSGEVKSAAALLTYNGPVGVRFRQALKNVGIDASDFMVKELLIGMQSAHDDATGERHFMATFEAKMHGLARAFNLHYEAPKC